MRKTVNQNYYLELEKDVGGGNARLQRKNLAENELKKKKGNQKLRMRFVQFVYVDYFWQAAATCHRKSVGVRA